YRHPGTVIYDSIPQVDGDASSDDMASNAGVERYLILYQQNVGHSSTAGNDINTAVVADLVDTAVEAALGDFEGITHACLDFENPFYASLNNLRNDPLDTDGLEAQQSLIELVTECKRRHPNLKWGYYGFPNQRSNFIANQTVGTLATNPNTNYTAAGMTMTGAEWIQSRIEERYAADGPIIAACDYMSPTGYDRYPPIAYPGSTTLGNASNAGLSDAQLQALTYDVASSNPSYVSDDNQYHLRYSLLMGMCRYYREQLGRPFMPAYPFVTMHYEKLETPPSQTVRWMPRRVPIDELLTNQVKPYLDGGAQSVMWWTAYEFRIDQSFDTVNYPLETTEQFEKFRDQYREAYVLDYPDVFGLTNPTNIAWKSVDWTDNTIRDNLKRAVRDSQINYFKSVAGLVRTYGAAKASTLTALA
ncbi:MAG: hypothetical protein ACO3O3_10170, partial [Ilumatobacteraceae bacterium]